MDSSIAEKGGDNTSCAAASANNPSSVKNVDKTKDKDSRRVSIAYKADSDTAVAAMTGKKDWSQEVKDDPLAKSISSSLLGIQRKATVQHLQMMMMLIVKICLWTG